VIPTTARRPLALLLTAGLVTLLLAIACGGSEDPDPSPTEVDPAPSDTGTATATAEATTAPTEEATPTVEVLLADAGTLPRSLSYGGPVWDLTDAVITNQDPAAYVAGETARMTAQTYLILDFELRNESIGINFVTTSARVQLTLADGTVVEGDDIRSRNLPPASSEAARYAFEVPAGTTFEGLTLVIGDPGREPSVVLPLTGDPPPIEENTFTELDLPTAVPLPGIDVTWTLNGQYFGRDWPLPFGFAGGTRLPVTRSEAGQRWLGITVHVAVGDCACAGGTLDQAATVRLFVDGAPVSPEARDSSNELMNAQTTSDVMLVFAIPQDTLEAELQIGPLDEPDEQVRIPLTIQEPPE
jgi:hypothetical protein